MAGTKTEADPWFALLALVEEAVTLAVVSLLWIVSTPTILISAALDPLSGLGCLVAELPFRTMVV